MSIGVPTYNRPELLERTLSNLVQQTWPNIEIIVSDNASTDSEVAKVIEKFVARDGRIVSFRQQENIGPLKNFFFVLKKSKGPYFMWAADDDLVEPWFIERSMRLHLDNPGLAIATSEVQYMDPKGLKLPFIAEGSDFRFKKPINVLGRMTQMLGSNYGNLVYGLFSRGALIQDGEVFWEKSGVDSLNEIPPLLYAAFFGAVIVSPDIGLYKQVPASVHAQVCWEIKGGLLPSVSRMSGWRSVRSTWNYHIQALLHIERALNLLSLESSSANKLLCAARRKLALHFIYMLIGYKPKFTRAFT